MSKVSRPIVLCVALAVLVGFLQTSASAHHRPDHTTGKPSPSPSDSPSPSPSPSPTPVNVTLEVGAWIGMNAQAGRNQPLRTCSVVVLEGAVGEDVLKAAVAAGCVESYRAEWVRRYEFSDLYWDYRLVCLDDLCNDDLASFSWYTYPGLDHAWATEGSVFEAYYRSDPCLLTDCV